MYESVLIPTDGSDSARRAAERGVALADRYGAAVHVLSVVDERDYDTAVVDGETLVEEGRESAEGQARRAVAAVADLVEAREVTTRVEVGVPAETILAYVEAEGIDVVAMGTHGRTGVERFVIGSVAERVVRAADVPVLTVRATASTPSWPPVDRVLVPTDGSDAAVSAFPYAFDLAERFDATVDGLYVIDERTKSGYYDVATVLEDVAGGLEATAERATDRLRDAAADRGLEVTTDVVEGLPSEAICERAADTDADAIVMATHGRTGLERVLLGSVAERVVRNSTVPVLTTPVGTGRLSRSG
jgi:nucleotide-binding universal stress UspA family protein